MPQANALISPDDFGEWRRVGATSLPERHTLISYIDECSDEIQRYCRRDLTTVRDTVGDTAVDRGGGDIFMPAPVKMKLLPYRLRLPAGLHPGDYERTRTAAW